MQFKEQNEQPSQRQTAKEVIAANIQILIEQLESGHSDALTAYLTAMGRFHHYSFGNILEIARQKPDAQRVAGLHVWNRFGRRVKKGEKGIRILAPIIAANRQTNDETEKNVRQNGPALTGFRAAYVFDVSQTEGNEIPEFASVKGDIGENYDRLISFLERQGIELEFNETIAPAMGISYGGQDRSAPGPVEGRSLLHFSP